MKYSRPLTVVASIAMLGLAGCSTTGTSNPDMTRLQERLDAKEREASELQQRVAMLESRPQSSGEAVNADAMLLPPTAKPGECYARLFVPPTYRTSTEQVLKRGAAEQVAVIPAKYEWVDERVLVKEASETGKLIPAKYEFVEERVLVREESERLIDVPATYETLSEKVLVKPAYTTWKKGRGPIEKVDHATGEIMCLVEVPAEYKTISKRVMKSGPTTRKEIIPAEYKTVRKRVMVAPPRMETVAIPAEYKTIRVKKMVAAPQEKRTTIPAEYQTVSKREKVTDGYMEWRSILCETNASNDLISRVQRALLEANHNPGPIDGVLGKATMAAVNGYQREKGLATGQLTLETIRSLGIKPK
ncbi:MAG: peptidoglycan-binding protein [Gammaproteobacteria bacterium]|nr:peptidoglycan-binding protein [Gammaproteobacteria bacterium]